MKHQAYVVLAQDLNSDDAEWSVCTGKDAFERAQWKLSKWVAREGRWVGNIRKVSEDTEL